MNFEMKIILCCPGLDLKVLKNIPYTRLLKLGMNLAIYDYTVILPLSK